MDVLMMRRLCIAAATLGVAIGGAFGVAQVANGASTCSNTFPADGHTGPYVTSGSTIHLNTVQVSCPTQSTSWSNSNCIQSNAGGTWDCVGGLGPTPNNGTGDTSYSISYGNFSCLSFLLYRSHVHNVVTGGNQNKPSGGGGVSLC